MWALQTTQRLAQAFQGLIQACQGLVQACHQYPFPALVIHYGSCYTSRPKASDGHRYPCPAEQFVYSSL